MPFLAVADDLTGAHDLGGRLAGRGAQTWVARRAQDLRGLRGSLVLDVETRFAAPGQARRAVQAAWAALPGGAALRFQKIDSTLRGNPGEEIEGMLLATAAPWVAVLPAYPGMGRTTRQGSMYVNGVRLDRSEFVHDPLTPARAIRPAQLFPPALGAHAPLATVAGGPSRLRAWMAKRLAAGARFITFDCVSEAQVGSIATACLKMGGRHFAGASGLAGALAQRVEGPAAAATLPKGKDWVILAGTVSARSFEQLAGLQASGEAHWEPRLRREGSRWFRGDRSGLPCLRRSLHRDGALALSSLACREDLAGWRRAHPSGPAGTELLAGQAVEALAAWGLKVGQPRSRSAFLVTGGHSLAAFFDLAGLRRFNVLGEALPGLPVGLADGPGGSTWLASKPGGFGSPDLYVRFLRLAA